MAADCTCIKAGFDVWVVEDDVSRDCGNCAHSYKDSVPLLHCTCEGSPGFGVVNENAWRVRWCERWAPRNVKE